MSRILRIKFIHLALILATIGLIFLKWFSSTYFFNGDLSFYHKNSLINSNFLTTWKGYSELGLASYDIPLLLILGTLNFMADMFNVGFNDFGIKILFFYPYIFLTPIGMYFLVFHLTKSRFSSLISSLVYTLNTTIFSLYSMGHILLTMNFVIFPYLVLFTLKYFENTKPIYLLTLCLLFLLSSYYELRMTYLAFIWLLIFIAYFIFLKNYKKKALFLLFSVGITLFLFNLFWVLPYLFLSESQSNIQILGREMFGSGFISIGHAFTNLHPFWSNNGLEIFTKQPINSLFFILPIFTLYGIYLNRKKSIILPFIVLFVIGIFFTKHSNIPFVDVYGFFYSNIPGFNAFRESTKFLQITTFSTSLFIGLFFSSEFFKKFFKLKVFLSTLVFVLILFNSIPIIDSRAKTLFVPRDVSDVNYKNLNQFLEKDNHNNFFRILWIPQSPNLSTIKDSMPHISLSKFAELVQKASNVSYSKNEKIYNYLLDPNVDKLLDEYSVKYVILANTDSTAEKNVYYYSEPKQKFSEITSKLEFLNKIKVSNSNIEIYENKNFKPHLYLIGGENFSSDTPKVKELNSKQVSPTQYDLLVKSDSNNEFLVFSEAYHPDWKLRVGEHNWFKSLWNEEHYYSNFYHQETSYGLNIWTIDLNRLRQQGYQEGDIVPITLYFAPQAWMNLGLIISGSTFIIILVFLAYFTIKKYEKK